MMPQQNSDKIQKKNFMDKFYFVLESGNFWPDIVQYLWVCRGKQNAELEND